MKILKHLNIVKLLEVMDIEDTLFVVMEYLSGGNYSPTWRPKTA